MLTLETLQPQILAAVPGAKLTVITNGSPSAQHSLLVDNDHAVQVATFLRDAEGLRFDMATSVSGVDWLDSVAKTTVKTRKTIDGVEKEVDEVVERPVPGYLEVVYHLYSIQLKQGPLVLRLRTADRAANASVPSLTPVWRGAEFQEREVFDLYGVQFTGHPDLRRILMWEEFKDFPMRKDYVEPDDFEYEPTPHDEVLKRARGHQGAEVKS